VENTGPWLVENCLELSGALLGIAYIILSVKEKILTWPAGLLSSLLYVAVFYQSKFYAGMGLQVYYVIISIYGWYYWLRGSGGKSGGDVPVRKLRRSEATAVAVATPVIFFAILMILLHLTDSPVPYPDALSTSLSIVATWMLARKILENWLIWIVADLIATGLYLYREMWPTTLLFLVYTLLAVAGYKQWKNSVQPVRLS